MKLLPEMQYPVTFRQSDANRLGTFLKSHESVVLFGMKRVGISNFLRFFLYHPQIEKTYLDNGTRYVFIPVDLNDLVERDIFPFWTLVLKRIVDRVEELDVAETVKVQARKLFIESIQLKDLFFTVDTIGKVLRGIGEAGYYPTLFLLRFDRLEKAVTPQFFNNLQGLKEAVNHKMSYVITSFRPLHEIAPEVFTKQLLSGFAREMYLKPATETDMKVMLGSYVERYTLTLSPALQDAVVALSGGHAQYLQLALMKLHDAQSLPESKENLFSLLAHDEEATLQSEELYESLTPVEKDVLLAVSHGQSIEKEKQERAKYLFDMGMVIEDKATFQLFNPLFGQYIASLSHAQPAKMELTKKEHLLLSYLKVHAGELCERDGIIEAVWPENGDLSVSDWSIDRLVSRVRNKLKQQHAPLEIVTVKTRGYKLIQK